MPYGCLALLLFAWFLVLLPFFLADAMLDALAKLGLSPETSFLAALGMFVGGMVNIPIYRVPRDEIVLVPAVDLFGFDRIFPRLVRQRHETVIAVNVGGCLIPSAIAVYELGRLAAAGPLVLLATLVAVTVNVAVCHLVARPIPNVGIAMPPAVPALTAVVCSLPFGDLAPAVAFAAGVLGPLIGADILNLRRIEHMMTGVASIGGAGTFDGIVLSGLVATLLA